MYRIEEDHYSCKGYKDRKQSFYGDSKLKTITIKSSKIKSKKIGKSAFAKINKKATIRVPKKKLSAYKKIIRSAGAAKSVKIKK